MKNCSFSNSKRDSLVGISLLQHVGSVHNNINKLSSSDLTTSKSNLPIDNTSNVQWKNSEIKILKSGCSSATISFDQICYHIWNRKETQSTIQSLFYRSRERKQILNNITGFFSQGMNAILGPSGCGKSSLLDILADRKDRNQVSGQVFVSGKPINPSYKYKIGYVVQEDIISGTLTVRENLMFSINIRSSNLKTTDERKSIVNRVIEELGLLNCADTRIGTNFIRGISGGEKRRVCIGMELVLQPTILFLDEPTSGLDASTAETVMKCLHFLSRRGCTIIFSIHQPRYSIFKLFDTILLLSSGCPVYLGSSNYLINYFSKYGFNCEEYDNPADFALDVIIHCHKSNSKILEEAYLTSIVDFQQTSIYEKQTSNSDEIIDRSFLGELYFVSQRTFRNTIRDPAIAASQIIIALLLAILTGLIFNKLEKTIEPGIQNRVGAIFFIVINQVYSTTTALEPLVHERILFLHEYRSGYYHVFTYFLAKLICDLLPMRIIPTLIYSSIAYFPIGFQTNTTRFIVFLTTIFISTLFGSAVCFLVASIVPIFVIALIVVIFIFVVMIIFSGFLIDIQSIFTGLQWIKWLSAFRYTTNLLMMNEFQGIRFCVANKTTECPVTGEAVLDRRHIDYKTSWDFWKNYLVIFVMTTFILILSYIRLVRMKKF